MAKLSARVTKICCKCTEPSLRGIRGQGYCQYHWDVMNWGKEWADLHRENQQAKNKES